MSHPLTCCFQYCVWQVNRWLAGLLSGHDRREILYGSDVLAFCSGCYWYSGPKRLEEIGCCHNGEVMLQSHGDLGVHWV
jgi:hypothetical protein